MSEAFTDPAGPGAVDPRLARLAARNRMPEDAPLPPPDPQAERNRAGIVRSDAARIAELERQIALLLAATMVPYPHGVTADGTEVPDAGYAYAHPEQYGVILLLATGETVGAPNVQSSHHHSPRLGRDVPVTGCLINAAAA